MLRFPFIHTVSFSSINPTGKYLRTLVNITNNDLHSTWQISLSPHLSRPLTPFLCLLPEVSRWFDGLVDKTVEDAHVGGKQDFFLRDLTSLIWRFVLSHVGKERLTGE